MSDDPDLAAEEEHAGEHRQRGDARALSALDSELALGVGHDRESLVGRGSLGFPHGRFRRPVRRPDELQRRMAEFAEQLQGQQKLAWADNAIKLAVDMTVAAINRINLQGNAEAQAAQIREVMALVFPEAVTLVREARAGLQ